MVFGEWSGSLLFSWALSSNVVVVISCEKGSIRCSGCWSGLSCVKASIEFCGCWFVLCCVEGSISCSGGWSELSCVVSCDDRRKLEWCFVEFVGNGRVVLAG